MTDSHLRMLPPRSLLAVLCLAVTVVLAGCGQNTSEGGDASGESGGDESSEEQEYESPLAEYLGVDFGFSEGDEAEFEAQQLEVNELVKACMAAEGFEWEPDPNEMAMMEYGGPGSEDGLEWGSTEWTAKYGFGISTLAFPQDIVGDDLVGDSFNYLAMEETEMQDPNQAYVDSLSEADQMKYYEVLYGADEGPDIDPSTMTEEEMDAAFEEYFADYVPTGCYPIAQEEIMGMGPGGSSEGFFIEFGQELEDLFDQLQNDPRITTHEQEISNCVADKGQTYTSMDDVYREFERRMEPLYEEAFNAGPDRMLSEEEMEAMTEEELNQMFMPSLSAESLATLAEIQSDEIALAVAVEECGGGQTYESDIFNEVRIEYEQRFIDENKAAIDAFLAESGADSDESDG